jgi:ubiquinone/menaquinone biosynthesis C-methylase UbiE
MSYDLESYWSRVAGEIRKRGAGNYVAGDDDPYYRYKRAKFLRRFLTTLDISGRRVLELGCGPGGNLLEISRRGPASLVGIDISASMIDLARQTLEGRPVELKKTDGHHLPLEDRSIDLAYTVTVLQHNVDNAALARVIAELCRVTADRIVIMEDTGTMLTASEGSTGITRPIGAYRTVFERHAFRLEGATYLNLRHSRHVHAAIRRRFVAATHREGEPLGIGVKTMLAVALSITRRLDDRSPDTTDLTKMVFVRA